MSTIKLTSKRQATFPKSICEAMHLSPGSRLTVAQKVIDGKRVWCLIPLAEEKPRWFGCLHRYARGKTHDIASIQRSVRRRLAGDRS